jgi:phosphomannomutase
LPNREWVAFRASGTEPLIRCYIEAKSATQLRKLREACQKLVQS